jgi:hypothetical protein
LSLAPGEAHGGEGVAAMAGLVRRARVRDVHEVRDPKRGYRGGDR